MSDTPSYQEKIVTETNEELSKDVEPTQENMLRTINFMINQMQALVEAHTAERTSLLRELVDCHKEIDRVRRVLHKSKIAKIKLFMKKIFIALGWYEPSSQELQLIFEEDFGAVK